MPCKTVEIKTPAEGNNSDESLSNLELADCGIEPASPSVGQEVVMSADFANTGTNDITINPTFIFGPGSAQVSEVVIPEGGNSRAEATFTMDEGAISVLGTGTIGVEVQVEGGGDTGTFTCGTMRVPEISTGDETGNNGDESTGQDGQGETDFGDGGGRTGGSIPDPSNNKMLYSAGIGLGALALLIRRKKGEQ